MAVLDVEGSSHTKQLTGEDWVNYLVSHYGYNREFAQKEMEKNTKEGNELFIRSYVQLQSGRITHVGCRT